MVFFQDVEDIFNFGYFPNKLNPIYAHQSITKWKLNSVWQINWTQRTFIALKNILCKIRRPKKDWQHILGEFAFLNTKEKPLPLFFLGASRFCSNQRMKTEMYKGSNLLILVKVFFFYKVCLLFFLFFSTKNYPRHWEWFRFSFEFQLQCFHINTIQTLAINCIKQRMKRLFFAGGK